MFYDILNTYNTIIRGTFAIGMYKVSTYSCDAQILKPCLTSGVNQPI